MIYSEAVYFDGAHFAHIAAYEERRRLAIETRRGLALLGEAVRRVRADCAHSQRHAPAV